MTASQVSVVHTLPSLQLGGVPAVQTPLWQVSFPLHTVPSAQDVPFATAVFTQPVSALHVSVVHAFASLQLSGVPAVQEPFWHVSAPLQTVPSAQEVPFATTGFWHTPALQTSLVQGFPSLQSAGTLHDWQPAIGVWTQPLSALHESIVHAFPSLQLSVVPAVHTPTWHVSAPLHTVPSAHDVPLATAALTQPRATSQLSVVQTFPSLQLSGVPAVHTPLWHVSLPLHTVPSAHELPFATAVFWQPVTGLQLSVVQTLPSLQLSGVPAVHVPFWQVSTPLHTVPSAHDVPFATAAFWQPLAALQESMVHGLPSLQLSGVPVVQVPFRQVSAPLHTVPSAHDVPFVTAVCWQPRTGSQVSVVHGLPSSQLSGAPLTHSPPWHVSPPLQTVASPHDVPFVTARFTQPEIALQVSVVQGLLSLQLSAVPAVHTPPWHVSLPLHTLESLHAVPFVTGVCRQPRTGSQVSTVHTVPSSQLGGIPGVHTPLW
jgi:hypothetical protein